MSDVRVEKKADEVFCFSCGAIIKKEAEICPKCGVRQNKPDNVPKTDSKNGFAIASMVIGICGIVFSWLYFGTVSGIVGLILGIIGLKSEKKGMAIAGIILNSVGFILGIILIIVLVGVIVAVGTAGIFNWY